MPQLRPIPPTRGLAAYIVDDVDLNPSAPGLAVEVPVPEGAKRATIVAAKASGTWATAVVTLGGAFPPTARMLRLAAGDEQIRASATAPALVSPGAALELVDATALPLVNLFGAVLIGLEVSTVEGAAGTAQFYVEFHA
jgi:hypothetical protein